MITTNIKPISYHNYSGNITTQSQRHISSGIMGSDGETDPLFRASPAATITYEDIELWNSGGSIDLSSYITKDELAEQSYISSGALNEMSYVSHDFLSSQAYLTTELEPAFNASPAATISQEQIDSWDSGSSINLSAYVQKSELSAQSYITSNALNGMSYVSHEFLSSQAYIQTETEPAFNGSPAATITYNDIANWSAAAGTLDMSAYLTKVELNAQSYVTSAQLVNCGYVSQNDIVFPDYSATYQSAGDYVTPSQLTAQGYITGDVLSSQSYITPQVLSEQSYLTVELEPAFNASPAAGITAADITRWDSGGGDLSLYVQKSELSEQAYITPAQLYSMSYITQSDIVFPDYSATYQSAGDYVTKSQLSDQSYVQFSTYTKYNKNIIYDGILAVITRMDENTYTGNTLSSSVSIKTQDSNNKCDAGIQSTISYNGTSYTATTSFSSWVAPGVSGTATVQLAANFIELIPRTRLTIQDRTNTYKCNISFNDVTGTLQLSPSNGISLKYKGAQSYIASYSYVLEQMNDFVVSQAYIKSESDPIFSASPAAGITATDINNWNTCAGLDLSSYVQKSDLVAQSYITATTLDSCGYVTQNSIVFPDYQNTYQAVGDYLSPSDLVSQSYITSTILNNQAYVTAAQLYAQSYVTQNSIVFPDYSNTYQAKGDYISQNYLDNASYITQTTLDNCGYAMVRLVTQAQYQDRQDDILYVITDADPISTSEFTTYAYTFANYTSYSYINDRIDTDLVTKAELTAILANYMPKPDIIYETDGTTGLLGENASTMNLTNWQLQNVNFSGYRYVLAFIKQADLPISGTNSNYITPALVVYIPLDAASRSTDYDAYIGSTAGTNMNDPDVFFIVQCAIDSTKTKFKVVNQGSVAGTIWGDRNNRGRYCYKIEGYK